MLVALDENKNRIYAEEVERGITCFCPSCGEPLRINKGEIKRPYFSHKPNTACPYGIDRDNKSEWHIRMQEYFPKESREVRFIDQNTNEIHIADVFIEEKNTVIEFQKSHIEKNEFEARTNFHLSNGRRIIWIFDESKEKVSDPQRDYGKLRISFFNALKNGEPFVQKATSFIKDDLRYINGGNEHNFNIEYNRAFSIISAFYRQRCFKWMYKRKVFSSENDYLNNPLFSICIYVGGDDTVYRIISEENNYEHILLSIHPINMGELTDVDDFYKTEENWLQEVEGIKQIEVRRKIKEKEIEDFQKRSREQALKNRNIPSRRKFHF